MWYKEFCSMLCALALLLSFNFAPPVSAAEKASAKSDKEAKSVHPWASFNPGSWVEIKSTRVTKTAGKEKTSISVTKITVLEKTADKVFLENELTVNGETMKSKFDVPVKGYPDDADLLPQKPTAKPSLRGSEPPINTPDG